MHAFVSHRAGALEKVRVGRPDDPPLSDLVAYLRRPNQMPHVDFRLLRSAGLLPLVFPFTFLAVSLR